MEQQAQMMRSFHNKVKQILIMMVREKHKTDDLLLLDIGVGRGGDICKWKRANIKTVIGLDIDLNSIMEARKRYKEANLIHTNYSFHLMRPDETINKVLYSIGKHTKKFHMISCQFALHYFCGSLNKLSGLLRDVRDKLLPGGFFIGTLMDGDSVLNLLSNKDVYENSAMRIRKHFENPKGIGDLIQFALTGTLYFGENFVSNEYVIMKDVLVNECKNHNLELIHWTFFSEFQKESKFDRDHQIASDLNVAFAFKKL